MSVFEKSNTNQSPARYPDPNIHMRSKSNLGSTLGSLSAENLQIKTAAKYHEIDNYQMGKMLGEGKFGQVYQAIHKKTGMLVALKKIPKSIIR